MAPSEALYARPSPSPLSWSGPGEKFVVEPGAIKEMNEQITRIHHLMQVARIQHKNYSDRRRQELEFQVGDKVFLRVSPMKGVFRFGARGKLKLRFVGPFEILEKVEPVAYQIALPPHLTEVHDVFHISNLRRYIYDPRHIIQHEDLIIEFDLTFSEQPIQILDRTVK